ncbi:hypothetical protein QCN32_gp65 [Arthrobacter phage Niktson]|uniref:Uncharacterized protein n=1 Tax=Arthrobacter phage Niktson TaxID=2014347 RepID=A0A218M5N5_9CAUD|nr:hypothetical protein QCN32_gp65 [Arthrobacter phage Niktson]ASD52287.1 hypothetical protein NIKTSON_65 [Arthrobacter phage Niktson]ASD52381.1 hypothetical protein ELEPHANTMAN_65 [Arthrobacter phage ElephantMan]
MVFESTQALTWIITFVGLAGFLFVGKKKWWAWYINLGCQILWTVYAFATGQPAFLVSVAVFSVIFGINAYKWTRDELASRKLRNGVSQLQVGETFEHGDVKFTRNPDSIKEESNLAKHARHELELIGEEPEVIEWFVRVINEYSSFGHSGGSAWATVSLLEELLRFRPLTELTDDPEEWVHHGSDMWPHGDNGVWQSKRDGRCFSNDGGKTYTCVDDDKVHGVQKVYTSISKEQWLEDHAHVSAD